MEDKQITLSDDDFTEVVRLIFKLSQGMYFTDVISIHIDEHLHQRLSELVPDFHRPIIYTLIDEYHAMYYDQWIEEHTDSFTDI